MKIGDYVRTKDYGIHKISNLEHYDYIDYIVCENQFNIIKIDKNNIIKSSPNIIDLIEVGDYVNGYFIEGNKGNYLETSDIDGEYSYLGHIEYRKIYERDIETIITKEQFGSMEYRIGE